MIYSRTLIMFILVFSAAASASSIKVGVMEAFEGSPVFFISNVTGNLVKFSTEFYNTGTIPYKARMRIDVFDEKRIFSGWSKEKPLMPGDRDYFEVFWYSEEAGNFTVLLRAYFGNEIVAYDSINLSLGESNAEEAINISVTSMSYDSIGFFLDPDMETVIIPYNYNPGWIFEQSADTVSYEPTVWVPCDVSVYAVSLDGEYYGKKTFRLDVEDSVYEKILSFLLVLTRIFIF